MSDEDCYYFCGGSYDYYSAEKRRIEEMGRQHRETWDKIERNQNIFFVGFILACIAIVVVMIVMKSNGSL